MDVNQELISKAKEILRKVQASGGDAFIIGETIYRLTNGKKIKDVYIYATLSETKFIEEFSSFKVKRIESKKYQLGYFGYDYIVICDNPIIDKYKIIPSKNKSRYSRFIKNAICQSDYTIYAMAMNSNGIIYDLFSSRDDIYKKKLISIYAKPGEVFKETPYKMLDVVKLVSETGYKLEKKVIKAIKAKGKHIKKLEKSNPEIIAKYMCEIVSNEYSKEAIKVLYKSKLFKKLNAYKFAIKRQALTHKKDFPYVFFGLEMVKNNQYDSIIGKTVEEYFDKKTNKIIDENNNFQSFIELTIKNQVSDFSNTTLFTFGLDKCLMSNKINYVLGRSKKKGKIIRKKHKELVIHSYDELKVTKKNLEENLPNLKESDILVLYEKLASKVVEGKIKNQYEVLINYAQITTKNIHTSQADNKPNDDKHNYNIIRDEKTELNNQDLTFEQMQLRQIELQKKIDRLELEALKRELDNEINSKINATGILNDFEPYRQENVKNVIYALYYENLVDTEKYKKLKGVINGKN